MKTKLLYFLSIWIGLGMLQACTNEVDDLFDAPAQQRLNKDIRAFKELLVSSDQGWKMDYYPSATQAYGGFAITLKFDDLKVTVGAETTENIGQTEASLYSVKSDMGTTLNFDSYNSIFHYFSDPALNIGGGTGKGLEGDYEFIVMSYSQNEIVLKGKKTRNIIKMQRLTESAETYLQPIVEKREEISSVMGVLGYKGNINGKEISLSIPSDGRMQIQIGAEEQLRTAYMYTATGIRFYQPLSIGGQPLESLEWNSETGSWQVSNETLTPVKDPVYPLYKRFLDEYTMNYTYGSTPRTIPVKVVMRNYSPSDKSYTVEGLPFPLRLQYNTQRDCMEFITYTDGVCNFAVWEIEGKGSLSWGKGLGMIAKLRPDTDNVYDFVDNGAWGSSQARAIILWSADGQNEYTGFGGDTRFQYISLTKK